MDPNANLDELLELATTLVDGGDVLDEADHARMAELVLALDGWLRSGGFLPHVWTRDDGLHAYRVMLRDPAHDSPFAFDCRASNLDTAREQATARYPEAAVVNAKLIWQDAGRGQST